MESTQPVGVWATGGTANTAREFTAGAGVYNSTIYFGGLTTAPALSALNELYNGKVGQR